MENEQGLLKPAMNYGAVLGIGLVAISLIFYLVGLQESSFSGYLSYAVIAVALYLSINHFRDNALGGYISYGRSLGLGALICLFASVIVGFYTYIFLAFVDQSLIDLGMKEAYNELLDSGMSEDEAAQNMEMASSFMTPGFFAFSAFIGTSFFGFIEALIISIFTKREDPDQIA